MRRRQWLFVALPLVLLTVAVVSTRMSGGSTSVAAATPRWAIDMVQDAGGTWCNPVNSTGAHAQGDGDYQVAICLMDVGLLATDFNVEVDYDSGLNTCVNGDTSGTALNANPDFISDVANPVGSWDCTGGGNNYPACGGGVAFITCTAKAKPDALVGNAQAIAVITFHVIAGGNDTLTFGTSAAYDWNHAIDFPSCPDGGAEACVSASDQKSGGSVLPTATSTALPTATALPPCGPGTNVPVCPTSTPTRRPYTMTPSPAPTNTPGAGESTVPPPPPPPPPPPSGGQQPSVTAPNTGTGSGGVSWATTLMWILGSGTALSLLAGGFYLRRVNNR